MKIPNGSQLLKLSWLDGNYHDNYSLFIHSKISRFISNMKLPIYMQSPDENRNNGSLTQRATFVMLIALSGRVEMGLLSTLAESLLTAPLPKIGFSLGPKLKGAYNFSFGLEGL